MLLPLAQKRPGDPRIGERRCGDTVSGPKHRPRCGDADDEAASSSSLLFRALSAGAAAPAVAPEPGTILAKSAPKVSASGRRAALSGEPQATPLALPALPALPVPSAPPAPPAPPRRRRSGDVSARLVMDGARQSRSALSGRAGESPGSTTAAPLPYFKRPTVGISLWPLEKKALEKGEREGPKGHYTLRQNVRKKRHGNGDLGSPRENVTKTFHLLIWFFFFTMLSTHFVYCMLSS